MAWIHPWRSRHGGEGLVARQVYGHRLRGNSTARAQQWMEKWVRIRLYRNEKPMSTNRRPQGVTQTVQDSSETTFTQDRFILGLGAAYCAAIIAYLVWHRSFLSPD